MDVQYIGNPDADTVLVQMVGDHELSFLKEEIEQIHSFCLDVDFLFVTVKVDQWNDELSPWAAPPLRGLEGFKGQAEMTLQYLQKEVVEKINNGAAPKKKMFLGGYSLAGLFTLWAAYQTDSFQGIAAASPSVWFPGFLDFASTHSLHTEKVYLSLGNKEEKTRHPILSQVGTDIRRLYNHFVEENIPCILEWNPGNHFKDPGLRMAKGWSWLLQK